MDFAVGDKVVYNPSVPDLELPQFRHKDYAYIINMDNHYLLLLFYNNGNHMTRILKNAISHAPYTAKWIRQQYMQVLGAINNAHLMLIEQKSKKIYTGVLNELVQSTYMNYYLNSAPMYNLDGE